MKDRDLVYHGSHEYFREVIPKRQRRFDVDADGSLIKKFDRECFHATPHRWIAMAYMANTQVVTYQGRQYVQKMGVNLYELDATIEICGVESLEKTLNSMYGAGGFLYGFKEEYFFHTEGLGNLEVITTRRIKPHSIQRVHNPVQEIKKHAKFLFVDLVEAKNAKYRHA